MFCFVASCFVVCCCAVFCCVALCFILLCCVLLRNEFPHEYSAIFMTFSDSLLYQRVQALAGNESRSETSRYYIITLGGSNLLKQAAFSHGVSR